MWYVPRWQKQPVQLSSARKAKKRRILDSGQWYEHRNWSISTLKIRCQEMAGGDCNRLRTIVCVCQWFVMCRHWVMIVLVSSIWTLSIVTPMHDNIEGDSKGVTSTYGAHFWWFFEQKVSYKPGSYTQYLRSYVRFWKHTTLNCAWPSLT
jgi:hypothetical protein